MSYRERRRPLATWRGVAIQVERMTLSVGQRTVIHEFPFRGEPFVEQLGRKARQVQIVGFVIGDEYDRKRDALIEAAERDGSGVLVHPTLGRLTSKLTECDVTEERDEGGKAALSLTFIESGARRFPGIKRAPAKKLAAANSDARDGVGASYGSRFSVELVAGWVRDSAIARAAGLVVDWIENAFIPALNLFSEEDYEAFTQGFGDAVETIVELLDDPEEIATYVITFMAGVPFSAVHRAFLALSEIQLNPTSSELGAGSWDQDSENAIADVRMWRRAAVLALVDSVQEDPLESLDDAEELRDEILSLLEREINEADVQADAETFNALYALRLEWLAWIDAVSLELSELLRVVPNATLPALVWAARYHDEADRDAEIVERNGIEHPLFVPAGVELVVLAS